MTRLRNDLFDASDGFDRGRPFFVEAVWYLLKIAFFLSALPWPSSFKCRLLRLFGAQIGAGVVIKPRVTCSVPPGWRINRKFQNAST